MRESYIVVNNTRFTFKLFSDKNNPRESWLRNGSTIRTLLKLLEVSEVVDYEEFLAHYEHRFVPETALRYAFDVMGLLEYTKTDDNKLGLKLNKNVYYIKFDGMKEV